MTNRRATKISRVNFSDNLERAVPIPLLSFCIPTYNRAAALIPLVKRLLKSESDEIEIVVSDNCSTDATQDLLASLSDSRLTVIRQRENRGALFNQVSVLVQGSGTYSVLLLDKDSVDVRLLDAFLDFLREVAPATGYCKYHQPAEKLPQIFEKGQAGLMGIAYSCHHPSGYFFSRQALIDIRITERFTDHNVVGNFPFEFMQAELALTGQSAIYNAPVFVPESLESAQAIRSFTINAARDDAFFSPVGRLNTALRFSLHISQLPISERLKRRLVLDRFAHGLMCATVDYRSIMANKAICDHYHVNPRDVGRRELLTIAVKFYWRFVRGLGTGSPLGRNAATVLILDTIRRATRRFSRNQS